MADGAPLSGRVEPEPKSMKSDYDRNLSLICPTCAATDFSFDETEEPSSRRYTCVGCSGEFSHEEILEGNQSRIDNAVGEMKHDVISDIRKDWSKLFKRR
jgi:hypothetical protein